MTKWTADATLPGYQERGWKLWTEKLWNRKMTGKGPVAEGDGLVGRGLATVSTKFFQETPELSTICIDMLQFFFPSCLIGLSGNPLSFRVKPGYLRILWVNSASCVTGIEENYGLPRQTRSEVFPISRRDGFLGSWEEDGVEALVGLWSRLG